MASSAEGSNEKDVGHDQRVISLIQSAGTKGVNDADIQKEIPVLTAEQRVSIINKLIAQGLLDLFNSSNGLVYKIKDPSSTSTEKLKGADNEERIVYSIIEEAGSKGIWIRDIRFKSNLIMTTLGKILKQLEGKKMIKAVKSVAASKKKVYMLYNLEPDRSLTGGAWYCDQDFEAEFVDVLNQQCYRYLQQRKEKTVPVAAKSGPLVAQTMAYAASKDVWKFITELGISKVQLSEDDIKTILDTLLYDGKVERILNVSGEYLYQAMESYLPPPGIVRMPCGICPLHSPYLLMLISLLTNINKLMYLCGGRRFKLLYWNDCPLELREYVSRWPHLWRQGDEVFDILLYHIPQVSLCLGPSHRSQLVLHNP